MNPLFNRFSETISLLALTLQLQRGDSVAADAPPLPIPTPPQAGWQDDELGIPVEVSELRLIVAKSTATPAIRSFAAFNTGRR
jgi:hypothetical protein